MVANAKQRKEVAGSISNLFFLLVIATSVARMVLKYGVGNVAVRENLNRAVIVAQLLLGQMV